MPAAQPEAEAEGVAEEPVNEAAPRTAGGLTVLVVDDDHLVLMNTAAMLEDLGYEVIEATSGEQALRMLRRDRQIDLVITDQLMPGMTGTQLLEAVKAEWPHMPAILATGYAELPPDSDPTLARLSKPFRQHDLARAMASVAEGERRIVPFRPKKA